MTNNKKIATRALLVALALVFSWVEAHIPAFFMVPGMKLGLTNLVVLVALYKLGWKDALMVNVVRIVIVGITFGNAFSMIYSLSGAIVSFLTMIVMKKLTKLNIIAISVGGGIAHNVGQILVAMFVFESTKLLYYLPFLWLSGIVAGAVIGMISGLTVQRLPDVK